MIMISAGTEPVGEKGGVIVGVYAGIVISAPAAPETASLDRPADNPRVR